MPKVSVVMPVYNVEEYLEECLLSVINQTLKDIEIICVNDGSTDSSLDILQKYAKIDNRITIISKENTGYGHSVNLGMDASHGEYISVVETDDYIDSTMLEELYNIAVDKNLDVIKADFKVFVHENGERVFRISKLLSQEFDYLYNKITNCRENIYVFWAYLVTWAGIYRRDFLYKNNIRHNETPGASFQDNGFWFRVTMHAKRIYFLDKAFYNLRRDNPNSSVFSKEKVFAFCDEYAFIKKKILTAYVENEKELLGVWFKFKLGAYGGNLKRISKENRQIFWERMRTEFRESIANGEIVTDYLSADNWNYIYTVLYSDEPCLPGMTEWSTQVKERLKSCKDIYIYGAGAWGSIVYNALEFKDFDEKIKAFLVTEKTEEQKAVKGLPVMELDTCDIKKEDLIIIAVADKNLGELIIQLHSRGYANFILKNCLVK